MILSIFLLSTLTVVLNPYLAQIDHTQVIIFVSPEEGGTTNSTSRSCIFGEGASITLTVTANDGYLLQNWTAFEAGDPRHSTT